MSRGRLFLALLAFGTVARAATSATSAPDKTLTDILAAGKTLETKSDYLAACRVYLSALPDHAADPRLRSALDRAGRGLSRQWEARRQKVMRGHVRNAQIKVEHSLAVQKTFRARVAEAQRFADGGQWLRASDAFNTLLMEAPGLDDARARLERLNRRMSAKVRRGAFPTPRHRAVWEGVVAYNRGDFEAAAHDLRLALSVGALPPELAPAEAEKYAAMSEQRIAEARWREQREALLAKAEKAAEDGDLPSARSAYEAILARDNGDVVARAGLDALGAVAKVVEKAVDLEVRRKGVPDLLAQGTLHMIHDRYTEAMESFNAVLQLEPNNLDAREQIKEVQRLMKGRKLFVPPVDANGAAEAKFREGLRYYGDENYSAARGAFEEALAIDPRYDDARQALLRLNDTAPAPGP